MFQPSFEPKTEAPEPDSESDEDMCPHCGRGFMADEMELELAEDEAEDEDAEPAPEESKAAFIQALRKESR